MPRYADCIFLYPHSSGGPTAANSAAITEEKTTLAARSVQRYLDRTPTDAVRCFCCRSCEMLLLLLQQQERGTHHLPSSLAPVAEGASCAAAVVCTRGLPEAVTIVCTLFIV